MKPGAAYDTEGIAYNKVHKLETQRPDHDVLEIATGYPVFRARPPVLDGSHRRIGVDVAGSCAVAQLADRVTPVRIFLLLVRIGLVVIGMTSGAVRLERGRAPVDCLGVSLVTFRTGQVALVIKWLIWKPAVAVNMRCPPVVCMAKVTFLRGDEVTGILARRNRAVVARGARANDLGMVHRRDR